MDEQIIGHLNQRLDRIIEQGRGMIDEEALKRSLETSSKQLQEQVRRYPFASMVVGFAAGFVLARLFSRRSE
jgi:ElaB/YqjD/DUF883 family membrane-anchored ribosome-binding protein